MEDILGSILGSIFGVLILLAFLEALCKGDGCAWFILVVLALFLILGMMLVPALISAREKARRISCASNLKQIGTAFALYTNAGEELLPCSSPASSHKNGTAALELLRVTGNLTDHKVYTCPSSDIKPGERNAALRPGSDTERNVSYAYIPGLSATAPGDSGCVTDGHSPGSGVYNHELFGNILFADGHVMSSTGVINGINWISKANWYATGTFTEWFTVRNQVIEHTYFVDDSWNSASTNGPVID